MDAVAVGDDRSQPTHDTFAGLVAFSAAQDCWIGYEPDTIVRFIVDLLYAAFEAPLIYVSVIDQAQKLDISLAWIDGEPVPDHERDHIDIYLEPYLAVAGKEPSSFPHPFRRQVLQFISILNETQGQRSSIAVGSTDPNFPTEEDHMVLQTAIDQVAAILNRVPDEAYSPTYPPTIRALLKFQQAKEALLKESQMGAELPALLTALLEHAPMGVAFFDRDHRYLRLNRVLAEMNGLSVEAHLEQTVSQVLPADTARLVEEKIDQVIATGQPVQNVGISGETLAVPGQMRHWSTSFFPVFSDDDQLLCIGETAVEVTESKHAREALQESHTLLQAVFDGTDDGIYVKDREGRYLMINSAGAELVGRSVEEVVDKGVVDIFPVKTAEKILADDRQVMASGQPQIFEDIVTINGTTSILHTAKAPYVNSEGELIGTIGISRDVTASKRSERFNRLLARTAEILSSSLDYVTRLRGVVELAVPNFADWCAVSIRDESQAIRQVAVAHVDPEKVILAEELQRLYPPDWDVRGGPAEVMRSGKPQLYSTITDEMLQAAAHNDEHLWILRELKLHSAMIVPLSARGNTLGVLTFIWGESGRHYTEADLAWAEQLGRRAGLAVDNALLYTIERQTRQMTEVAAKRVATLQEVTAALSRALTLGEVSSVILQNGILALGATSGAVATVDKSGDTLEILDAFGYAAESVEKWHKISLSASTPLSESARTNKPIVLETFAAVRERFPKFAHQATARHETFVALPLTVKEQVIGAVGITFKARQQIRTEDLDFMVSLTRQCAQALDRARLFEAEREARAQAEKAQEHLAILAEEKERNRLAQELHDNVAQALGYLNLRLSMADQSLSEGKIDEAQLALQALKQVVDESYTDVREEIFSLRSERHADSNFLQLLHRYIDKYKRFYRLSIQLDQQVTDEMLEFPADARLQIIRTIQEALINIRKHAQVNQAFIVITEVNGCIQISIEDQGCGFDAKQILNGKKDSFGLRIMKERIASVGGRVETFSTVGQGTQTVITVPGD